MIYFDYNATTPVDEAVVEAMMPYLSTHHGNPSSSHAPGKKIRTAIDAARQQLADLLGAATDEIVFTSGGSEANNHALKGIAFKEGKGHIIISAVEHPAVAMPARWLEDQGFEISCIGVDATGMVDPDEVRQALKAETILVSIMLSNNEVGTLQPIAKTSDFAHEAGALMHTDAAQAVGKIAVKVNDLGVDLLSVAGHKFHAPPGTGALFIRKGLELPPLIHGAKHESQRRAGTEAVPAIIGMGVAARQASDALASHPDGDPKIRALRDRFHAALVEKLGDQVVLNGHPIERLPNTISLGFPGHFGIELLGKMPDLCASAGAACHSSTQDPSAVLKAMGTPREVALGTIRFSLGRYNTEAEVDSAVDMVLQACTK